MIGSTFRDGSGWWRISRHGFGLAWKPKTAPLLFSQRMRLTRTWVIGSRRYWFLKPVTLPRNCGNINRNALSHPMDTDH